MANALNQIVASNPNGLVAGKIENAAFASKVSDDELASLENSGKLNDLVGKGSVAELTDEDKALLGFIKVQSASGD